MRIGLTCTTIEPAITQGKIDGIGTYTQHLLENLQQMGHHVTPWSFPQKRIPTGLKGGQFFRFPYTTSTLASLLTPARYSFDHAVSEHIDLLHVTDHMLPKLPRTPVVATLCDAIMFKHADWHWDSIRMANLKKWARKKTIGWADHYITISDAMIPELVEHLHLPPEKISVVHLGIADSWFETMSDEKRHQVLQQLKLPEHFLLFTGTLQHKKNLPRTIEAYLALPNDIQDTYPLVIAGRAGLGHKESMLAIHKLTSAKKGVWLDYVSLDALRALFQSASAYLHPSLHEGFGLTLLEAFASATPVITSNVTALPEIAGDAAMLVDPYSVESIREGIQKVIINNTLQQTLVQKGLDRAKQFTWKACAEKTLSVYRSLR